MTKTPRKSIVASFGLLSAELENNSQSNASSAPSVQVAPPGGRVGAGVIGAAHRAIDDIRAERDHLRSLLESGGGTIRELDTAMVDPSPYPDRLPDDDIAGFAAFKRSIESEGQKVPVQVRRNPVDPNRYQIVYGHRRWLAARELQIPVRAIEVEISDADLVVAQGIENASRQDLSWIERALFASRMDAAGIKSRHIYAALSIDDAELAKMRTVCRAIPIEVIETIGRAPKIGRPRWLDLARGVTENPDNLSKVKIAVANTKRSGDTSDGRFQSALAAVIGRSTTSKVARPIVNSSGETVGALVSSGKEVRIAADGEFGIEFIKFLERELPGLADRFSSEKDNPVR